MLSWNRLKRWEGYEKPMFKGKDKTEIQIMLMQIIIVNDSNKQKFFSDDAPLKKKHYLTFFNQ